MKSSEGSYLLSEVKWAISEEAGIVHPFLYMPDKALYLDLFTNHLMAYCHRADLQFARHYKNVTFECLDGGVVYCTYIMTNEGLQGAFLDLPNYDIKKDVYLDFVGEVYRLSRDIYATKSDLLSFANKIKQLRGIGEERVQFSACNDDPLYIPYRARRKHKNAV